jgi:hypothetical protein
MVAARFWRSGHRRPLGAPKWPQYKCASSWTSFPYRVSTEGLLFNRSSNHKGICADFCIGFRAIENSRCCPVAARWIDPARCEPSARSETRRPSRFAFSIVSANCPPILPLRTEGVFYLRGQRTCVRQWRGVANVEHEQYRPHRLQDQDRPGADLDLPMIIFSPPASRADKARPRHLRVINIALNGE